MLCSSPDRWHAVATGQGVVEEISYSEGGETLGKTDQRGGRCPIPGNIQGQVGWGSEQPDLVEDMPVLCRGVWLSGP